MESLFILIPFSLLFVGCIGLILLWAAKNGQFADLEGPGYAVLMDDDTPNPTDHHDHIT